MGRTCRVKEGLRSGAHLQGEGWQLMSLRQAAVALRDDVQLEVCVALGPDVVLDEVLGSQGAGAQPVGVVAAQLALHVGAADRRARVVQVQGP